MGDFNEIFHFNEKTGFSLRHSSQMNHFWDCLFVYGLQYLRLQVYLG